jgi:hypothetical protein
MAPDRPTVDFRWLARCWDVIGIRPHSLSDIPSLQPDLACNTVLPSRKRAVVGPRWPVALVGMFIVPLVGVAAVMALAAFGLISWNDRGILPYLAWAPVALGAISCLLLPISPWARAGIMMVYTPLVAIGNLAVLYTFGCLRFSECL